MAVKASRRSPIAADPSRTGALRRAFVADVRRRLARIERDVVALVVEEDVFGLRPPKPFRPHVFNEKLPGISEKFGALMLAVKDRTIVEFVRMLQSEIDPDDVLELEEWPHITVRYGFTKEVTPERIQPIIEQHGPIKVEIAGLSLFENSDADVLKFDIFSNDLISLYRHLGIVPNVRTYTGVHPHLTVAYLKPGTGYKYLNDLLWSSIYRWQTTIRDIVYSTPERVQTSLVLNQRWKFLTNPQKLVAFQRWIEQRFRVEFTEEEKPEEIAYWNRYVEDGYRKGAGRAFDQVRKKGLIQEQKLDFYRGAKSEFLRTGFANRESVDKVKLLASRTLTDLKSVSQTTAAQMSRVLTDGLVQGQNPVTIAKTLTQTIRKIARPRAETIARTEIIRAHSEGQLDAMEKLGVTAVGVSVEWSTAEDDRVCPLCRPMDGVVLKIKESHGLIPRHPNCRCAFTPANVGEDTDGQLRSKRAIEQAITDSIAKERPKKKKRTVDAQRRITKWTGADTRIDQSRPKSLF